MQRCNNIEKEETNLANYNNNNNNNTDNYGNDNCGGVGDREILIKTNVLNKSAICDESSMQNSDESNRMIDPIVPPRPVVRKSKLSKKQPRNEKNSSNVNGRKPLVDINNNNNNDAQKKNQIESGVMNDGVHRMKFPLLRHRSCPVPDPLRNKQLVSKSTSSSSSPSSESIFESNQTSSPLKQSSKIKETITKLDMVGSNENKTMPSIEMIEKNPSSRTGKNSSNKNSRKSFSSSSSSSQSTSPSLSSPTASISSPTPPSLTKQQSYCNNSLRTNTTTESSNRRSKVKTSEVKKSDRLQSSRIKELINEERQHGLWNNFDHLNNNHSDDGGGSGDGGVERRIKPSMNSQTIDDSHHEDSRCETSTKKIKQNNVERENVHVPTKRIESRSPTSIESNQLPKFTIPFDLGLLSERKKCRIGTLPNSQRQSVPDEIVERRYRRTSSLKQDRTNGSIDKIISPYERALHALECDKTWQKEIGLGRRIGLYRFRGDIGNGNFSQVKIATHSLTEEKVAIKILDKSRLDLKTRKMLSREIRTMECLHHPNLIRIFEVIESLSKHFIVMELAPDGELFQVISNHGRFFENEAKFFFTQILSAIDHMHQHNLIHRDIKAENVFFANPLTIKVGDFGFSTRIGSHDDLLSTFCGSPPYAAPELFRDENYRGPQVDYWALGVLLYFIVTGTMPFRAQNIVSLKKLIIDCRYDIPNYVSVECCQLIAGFLQTDPLKRYNLMQAKKTRWLQNQSINHSASKYDLKISYLKWLKAKKNCDDSYQNHSHDSIRSFQRHTIYGDGSFQNDYPPLNDDERETFHRLHLLGIDDRIIQDHLDKGSHSHIVGTFRIILHHLLQKRSIERCNQRKLHIRKQQSIDSKSIKNLTNQSAKIKSINGQGQFDRLWAQYASKFTQRNFVPTKRNDWKKDVQLNENVKVQSGDCERRENEIIEIDADGTKPIESINQNQPKRKLMKNFSMESKSSGPHTSPMENEPSTIESKKFSPEQHLSSRDELTNNKEEITNHFNDSGRVSPKSSIESVLQKKIKIDTENELYSSSSTPSSFRRLTRSFRALKQLLTENNLCGKTSVISEPSSKPTNQTIKDVANKPHVIHKTTTLQIVPTQIANIPIGDRQYVWRDREYSQQSNKLWRSHTTPDVSMLHQALPCLRCDNSQPHHCVFRYGNRKSFNNNNNRCTIV
ncbi:G protein pathway suppressor 1 [Sarcoptes scabiei]|nr:G protein pathway suppressor 1 [Sarcoptes scabiei]